MRNHNIPASSRESENKPYTQDVLEVSWTEEDQQAIVRTRQLGNVAIEILSKSKLGLATIYGAISPETGSMLQFTLYGKTPDPSSDSKGELRLITGSWPVS